MPRRRKSSSSSEESDSESEYSSSESDRSRSPSPSPVKSKKLTGYQLFCKEKNEKLKNPVSFTKLGEMWRKLSDSQQEKFKDRAKRMNRK